MSTHALLEIFPAGSDAPAAVVRQGTWSRLSGFTASERLVLLDRLLAGWSAASETGIRGRNWMLRRHVPAMDVGLVSPDGPLLAGAPLRESLLLAGEPRHLAAALRETGLLAGCDLDAIPDALAADARMEATFLQAWMREPRWLLLEPGAATDGAVRRLAGAFRVRFPLRAITILGRGPTLAPLDPDFDFDFPA